MYSNSHNRPAYKRAIGRFLVRPLVVPVLDSLTLWSFRWKRLKNPEDQGGRVGSGVYYLDPQTGHHHRRDCAVRICEARVRNTKNARGR
ncbi:hypothetical protein TK90_2623 (plasmid) [Thioalkalivibrio sp. K90mix]|nr:hypothetical protein TK90_2623 [Thioalkalivibrio sp. K90mix]